MSGRERVILISTLVVVLLALVYHYLLADKLEEITQGPGGDLEVERSIFKRYKNIIEDGRDIREEYEKLVFQGKEKVEGQEVGDTFSNQLFELLTTQLNVPAPDLSSYDYEDIEDVDDYVFVELSVNVQGTFIEMVRLLQNMQSKGLLIKNFSLARRGLRGGDIKMSVDVARLVKTPDRVKRRRLGGRTR
jgi:hypothetical protein